MRKSRAIAGDRPEAGQWDTGGTKGAVPLFGERDQRVEATGTAGRRRLSVVREDGALTASPSKRAGELLSLIASPRVSFDEALDGFLRAERRSGRASSTLGCYRRHLVVFSRFLASRSNASVLDITPEDVLAFFDHELSRERSRPSGGPLAAGTLGLTTSVLHAFFSHLVKEGLLLVDPSRDLHAPRAPKRLPKNIPTPRQMRRLVLTPSEATPLGKRDRAILELMYGTGLRASELCGLLLGDVDVTERRVFVRKGKGGKERLVPMGKKAAEAVTAYLGVRRELRGGPGEVSGGELQDTRRKEPLFLRRGGGSIRPPALRYIVERGRKRAQLSPAPTPHTLRHACATHLLAGGAGIRQIQVLLGHSSLETTQVYTRVETSDLRKMLDKHHPRSFA